MNSRIRLNRTRTIAALFAGAAAVALIAPIAGSAAVNDGHFLVKAQDDLKSEIVAISGMNIPEDENSPITGNSDQMIFTLDTRFEGCTAPRLNLTSSDPATVIDWGDGSQATGITPGTHSYENPAVYRVTVTGKVDRLMSVPVASANCFKSLDHIGEETGLTMMYASFQDAAHIEHVAKPPRTVNYMGSLFRNSGFNGNVSNWDTSNVTNMSYMFDGAKRFNQPIGSWNVSKVTNFGRMFAGATSFNQPIGGWDMASARVIDTMFAGATSFDQDLLWTTPSLTANIGAIFDGATAFNGDISSWDVSRVTNFGNAFRNAESFNRDISEWDVTAGSNFVSMFEDAKSFDQPLAKWETPNASDVKAMFKGAIAFDQDLSGWNVAKISVSQPQRWEDFAPHLDRSKIPAKFQ